MINNFQPCLTFTLAQEGGYVDNSSDPGGATNRGITADTYANWLGRAVTPAEVEAMPEVIAGKIYETEYWQPINGNGLPVGVDLVVFDFGVNAGTGTSAKMLQRFLQVRQDGAIGPETLAACAKHLPIDVIRWLGAAQHSYYYSLNMPEFIDGWLARTGRRVARAIEMASQ